MKNPIKNLAFTLLVLTLSTSLLPAQEMIKDGTGRNYAVEYDKAAEFPGGDEALYTRLFHEMEYPAEAKEKRITGDLTLSFFVETDSTVSEVSALNDLGYGTKEEAIRLIKSMKFSPAIQNGKAVRQQMMLPVLFRIYDWAIQAVGYGSWELGYFVG